MKRVMFVFLLLISQLAWGASSPSRVSSNTVIMTREGQIVTFNAVTTHIRLTNNSYSDTIYADLRCADSNGKRGYTSTDNCVVALPYIGEATPNTVELDFSTGNLGFVSDNPEAKKATVTYIVTSDYGTL